MKRNIISNMHLSISLIVSILLLGACSGEKASRHPIEKKEGRYLSIKVQPNDDKPKTELDSKNSSGNFSSVFLHPEIDKPESKVKELTEIFSPEDDSVDAVSILFSLGLKINGHVKIGDKWPGDLKSKILAENILTYTKDLTSFTNECTGSKVHQLHLISTGKFDPSKIIFGNLVNPEMKNFDMMLEDEAKKAVLKGDVANIGYGNLKKIAKDEINKSFKPTIDQIFIQTENYLSYCNTPKGVYAMLVTAGTSILGELKKEEKKDSLQLDFSATLEGDQWSKQFHLYDAAAKKVTEKSISDIEVNMGESGSPDFQPLFRDTYKYQTSFVLTKNEQRENLFIQIDKDVKNLTFETKEDGSEVCVGIPLSTNSKDKLEVSFEIPINDKLGLSEEQIKQVHEDSGLMNRFRGNGFFLSQCAYGYSPLIPNPEAIVDMKVDVSSDKKATPNIVYLNVTTYLQNTVGKGAMDQWPETLDIRFYTLNTDVEIKPSSEAISLDLKSIKEKVLAMADNGKPKADPEPNINIEIADGEDGCSIVTLNSEAFDKAAHEIELDITEGQIFTSAQDCKAAKSPSESLKVQFTPGAKQLLYVKAKSSDTLPSLQVHTEDGITLNGSENGNELTLNIGKEDEETSDDEDETTAAPTIALSAPNQIKEGDIGTLNITATNVSADCSITVSAEDASLFSDKKAKKKLPSEINLTSKKPNLEVYFKASGKKDIKIHIAACDEAQFENNQSSVTIKVEEKATPKPVEPKKTAHAFSQFSTPDQRGFATWTDLRFTVGDSASIYKHKDEDPDKYKEFYDTAIAFGTEYKRFGKYRDYMYQVTSPTINKTKIVDAEYDNAKSYPANQNLAALCSQEGLTYQFSLKGISVNLTPPYSSWSSDKQQTYKQLMIDQFHIMTKSTGAAAINNLDYSNAIYLFEGAVHPQSSFTNQKWNVYLCVSKDKKKFRSFFQHESNIGKSLWYPNATNIDVKNKQSFSGRRQYLPHTLDVVEKDGDLHFFSKGCYRRILPSNEAMALLDLKYKDSFISVPPGEAYYNQAKVKVKEQIEGALWNEISVHLAFSISPDDLKEGTPMEVQYIPPATLAGSVLTTQETAKIKKVYRPLLVGFPGNSNALYFWARFIKHILFS
ncbi:MAG: hypothetical protein KDD52_03315 [Bdellovibrionales bacterium]|nr:hypothetical protein [Bdellovibrionales bacterium]